MTTDSFALLIIDDELVQVIDDQFTIVSPGEDCLLCGDPIEPGTIVAPARFCGQTGLVDQSCEHLTGDRSDSLTHAAEMTMGPAGAGPVSSQGRTP